MSSKTDDDVALNLGHTPKPFDAETARDAERRSWRLHISRLEQRVSELELRNSYLQEENNRLASLLSSARGEW